MSYKKINISLCFLLLFVLLSCEPISTPIPNYPVYLEVNMIDHKITIPGTFTEITKPTTALERIGYGGVVIFQTYDENFVAYDLTCANEVNNEIKVKTEANGIATCPKCGATYDLVYGYGYPTSGPTRLPLRKYQTFVYDSFMLIVRN